MKFLTTILFLTGCATVPTASPTPVEMCRNLCENNSASEPLFVSANACVCKTELGVKDNIGICLIETGKGPLCVFEAADQCKDPKVKRQQDGFCTKLEIELAKGPSA